MNKNTIQELLRYVAVAILSALGTYNFAPSVQTQPVEGRCVQVAVPVAPVALPTDATVTQ